MRVRLVRRPGQHGTRAYVEQHGDRLICVRYRYDEAARRRYKTIEIIVDEAPWEPKVKERKTVTPKPHMKEAKSARGNLDLQTKTATLSASKLEPLTDATNPAMSKPEPHTLVGVRLNPGDQESYHRLIRLRHRWEPKLQVWRLTYDQALALGLTDRIIGTIDELTAAQRNRGGR